MIRARHAVPLQADSPTVIMRLLIDQPIDGATNMARDEALLLLVGQGSSPATLRFYQWDPPTISLGYFQKYQEYEQLPPPAGELAVVRRTTGGGAILHDREWTYSLTLPMDFGLLRKGSTVNLYELVHDALIDTLDLLSIRACRSGSSDHSSARRGPFFCFDRRHELDVLIADRKLAGSAQRRTTQAVLQHGSIMLANKFDQHQVATIQDHIFLHQESLLDPLIDALSRRLDVEIEPGEWSADELASTEEFKLKYASLKWIRKY